MVTLHVAAPGNGNATDDTTPVVRAEPTPASESASVPADVECGSEPRDAASVARRRRKPGLAGRPQQDFETPPVPVPPAPPDEAWGGPVEPDLAVEVDASEFSEETPEEDPFDGLTPEEFVVHVDDIFGRTSRWRPAGRARRIRGPGQGGIRERLAAHPWLAGCAALAIGLWVLLGILGALAGQHPAPHHPASSRLTTRGLLAHTAPAGARRRHIRRHVLAR